MDEQNNENYRGMHGTTLPEKLLYGTLITMSILSIVADIIIIFVILRFKKLRQVTTNNIIVNYSMLEIVPYLLEFTNILMIVPTSYEQIISCVLDETSFILHITVNLFMILLVCEWFIKTYHAGWHVKFSRYCNYIVWAIHGWNIVFCTIMVLVCTNHLLTQIIILNIKMIIMCLSFGFLLFVVIYADITYFFKKQNVGNSTHNTGLALANIFCVTMIPSILFSLVVFIRSVNYDVFLLLLVSVVDVSSPFLILCYLFCCLSTFNSALKRIFKCQCSDFSNESSDGQNVSYNVEQELVNILATTHY